MHPATPSIAAAHDSPTPKHVAERARRRAARAGENFSVLTGLVPPDLRDDFAAVYGFCRLADDLADEQGVGPQAKARALAALRECRARLRRAAEGDDTADLFGMLGATVRRRGLPLRPFEALLDAFELDQRIDRWPSWDALLRYCTGSANPVGRIVLMLLGYREDEPAHAERFRLSDLACTALQLTNFWQDVRRDLLQRDRVYMPAAETGVSAELLRDWVDRENDPAARLAFIRALRPLVDRTRELFESARILPDVLDRRAAPVVWLFGAGGRATLELVEARGCTTLWARPALSAAARARLVARAYARRWLARAPRGASP
jgi:squalene synthase HpnC